MDIIAGPLSARLTLTHAWIRLGPVGVVVKDRIRHPETFSQRKGRALRFGRLYVGSL